MTRTPKEKFAKWAASYQGMDGGNPKSELWFCGIEYGGTDEPSSIEFLDDVEGDSVEWERDISANKLPVPYLVPRKNGVINEALKVDGPFAIAQSKIATNYYQGQEPIDTWKKLVGKDGYSFKMNLYPMAFRSHNDALWEKGHYLRTGFISKSEYKTWNLNNRFPLLKQLVNQFQPKVLICFGLSLKSEFLAAFCDNDEQIFEEIVPIQIGDVSNKSNRTLLPTKINQGSTLLMICPFPTGAYGLNSDALLKQVSEIAKELSSVHPETPV